MCLNFFKTKKIKDFQLGLLLNMVLLLLLPITAGRMTLAMIILSVTEQILSVVGALILPITVPQRNAGIPLKWFLKPQDAAERKLLGFAWKISEKLLTAI